MHVFMNIDNSIRGASAYSYGRRVKGKRVQIPHDLVTVIRERTALMPLTKRLGRLPHALIFKPGNLPRIKELRIPERVITRY